MTISNPAKERECIFCDVPITKSTASREDTVPKWLQAELAIASAKVEPTLTSPEGTQLKQRIHPVDQLLTGGICRRCNNGWMSLLESEAQPMLRALIHSKRKLESLTKSERHTISRWATKTAFVLDAGGLEIRVPREQFRELYSNAPHLPEDLLVFARMQPHTQPWYYAIGAWWKHGLPLTEEAAGRVAANSYKIALEFGDLLLIVVYWPLANWGIRVERNELVKLWPASAIIKEYVHPQPMESSTSERACLRYITTIGVVPRRKSEGLA